MIKVHDTEIHAMLYGGQAARDAELLLGGQITFSVCLNRIHVFVCAIPRAVSKRSKHETRKPGTAQCPVSEFMLCFIAYR